MKINVNPFKFIVAGNKAANRKKLDFLKAEGQTVRRAMELQATRKEREEAARAKAEAEAAGEVVVEPIVSEDTGFVYRVTLPFAEQYYGWISKDNYEKFVNSFNFVETDEEILFILCLIDKCEEYDDAASMLSVFSLFEYIIRHKKESSKVIAFARQYNIEMRQYLTDLGLL